MLTQYRQTVHSSKLHSNGIKPLDYDITGVYTMTVNLLLLTVMILILGSDKPISTPDMLSILS